MASSRTDSTASQILKNQKGFALFLVLALMPLIMAVLIAYLMLNTGLQTWMHSLQICRIELLKTQNSVATDLENLLALNNPVRTVRAEIIATQAAIVAAAAAYQGYLIPPLQKTLALLYKQERALGAAQKALLASANFKMNTGLQKARTLIVKQYSQLTPSLIDFTSFRLLSTTAFSNRLAVKPDSPNVTAAVYEPANNFKRQQSLQVSWKTSLQISKGQWTRNWFNFEGKKQDSCTVSLEERNKKWIGILNEDKY